MGTPLKWAACGLLGVGVTLSAQYASNARAPWIEPRSNAILQEFDTFTSVDGSVGVLNAAGRVQMEGHPFFTPLGTNGRACVSCHQPSWGMSVSSAGLRERWYQSQGQDPVFDSFDGSNCPNLPRDKEESHSLLLTRGLFRIPLEVPKNAEFTIEVVHDPTGCNKNSEYGLTGSTPTVNVYRRPRPVANLKYVVGGASPLVAKTGGLADLDPATGEAVTMNLMADGREATLTTQALSAILGHQQAKAMPTPEQLAKIVEYESQVYAAQATHIWGGPLMGEKTSPSGLGPANLRDRFLGKPEPGVFGSFAAWRNGSFYQASIARGADLFSTKQFWIRDSAHANSAGMGNPAKGTCTTCHSSRMTGQDTQAGWIDVGTTNFPTWTEPATTVEAAELPVFKVTCAKNAKPHPYLGRTIYTTDPGRAMVSGKCEDVGAIVMQQLRGLAARAPYFVNGAAKTLREVVDYYDRRFDMKLTDQEKEDLITFLGVL